MIRSVFIGFLGALCISSACGSDIDRLDAALDVYNTAVSYKGVGVHQEGTDLVFCY